MATEIETDRGEAAALRDFIENVLAPLHWVGPDGTILWANEAELDLLGYCRDEYVGRHIAEFHADRDVIDDILARLARDERLRECPARLRHKDGSIRHVLINSSVYRRDGEFIHTRCLSIDVTDRKRIEEERLRSGRILAAQYAVAHVLAETDNLAEATHRVLAAVGDAGDWQLGSLWSVNEPEGVLGCVDVWHRPELEASAFESATRAATFIPGRGLPGRVWASGKPVWIADVRADGNFPRLPHAVEAGLRGAFGFPVRLRGKVTGVLEFLSADVREPELDLLEQFDAIGAQIGQFMQRRQHAETRERLAAIVDSSADAIISNTLEGVITSWNRGAQEIFGYTAREAIGQHISLIIPPERLPEEGDMLRRLARGERIDPFESERQAKGGRRLSVSLSVSPVRDADGRIVGASKVARDISSRKRTEAALRESEQRARDAVAARDEFLSIAAHELRNPLNALQLQLVGLHRAAQREDRELKRDLVIERLGQATDDVGRLVRLVHSLLDVSRITAGRIDLEHEALDFSTVVGAAVSRLVPQLHDRQMSLDLRSVSGTWDRLRLDQVVTNLVSNAIKYGQNKPIRVSLTADDDTAFLSVQDHGIGMDAEQQQRLFQRFERGVLRSQFGGFGLGLWITRQVVEAMGGRIAVESAPGRGSTFSVALPRRQPAAAK